MDPNGHLMGAIGAAILAQNGSACREFDFTIENLDFHIRETSCGRCSNNCEILCVYRGKTLIDAWGNRCERGNIMA